jgi:hypothetical protein
MPKREVPDIEQPVETPAPRESAEDVAPGPEAAPDTAFDTPEEPTTSTEDRR